MKSDLKKGLILLLFIIISLGIVLIINNRHNTNTNKNDYIESIINRIDNKEKILIYFSRNDSVECQDMNSIISYYTNTYNLNFEEINQDIISKSKYNKLLERLGYTDNNITPPSVAYISEGKVLGLSNYILTEKYFKNYLIKFGFISKESQETDNQISYKEFEQYFNTKSINTKLVLIYTYESPTSYDLREKIYNLSKKYDFSYDLVYYGLAGSNKVASILKKELKKDLRLPIIIAIKQGKIIDYVYENEEEKISKFLKKNNYIK